MSEFEQMTPDHVAAFLVVGEDRRNVGERRETVDEDARAGDGGAEIVGFAMIHRGKDHALDTAATERPQNGREAAGTVLGIADEEGDAPLGKSIFGTPDDVDRVWRRRNYVGEESDHAGAAGAHRPRALVGNEVQFIHDRLDAQPRRLGDGARIVEDPGDGLIDTPARAATVRMVAIEFLQG